MSIKYFLKLTSLSIGKHVIKRQRFWIRSEKLWLKSTSFKLPKCSRFGENSTKSKKRKKFRRESFKAS